MAQINRSIYIYIYNVYRVTADFALSKRADDAVFNLVVEHFQIFCTIYLYIRRRPVVVYSALEPRPVLLQAGGIWNSDHKRGHILDIFLSNENVLPDT